VAAAVAATTAAAGEEAPATLSVLWVDPSEALPVADQTVARELRSVLASAGVALDWRASAADMASDAAGLRVVLLAREAAGPTDVMGSVYRGSRTRTAWINLPAVRRTLRLGTHQAAWPAGSPAALARALARVIAHELVHILAPEMPHAREGLMAAKLGPRFLTGREAAVSAAVADALRRGARPDTHARGYEGIALASAN
jgi:hypothetical protein